MRRIRSTIDTLHSPGTSGAKSDDETQAVSVESADWNRLEIEAESAQDRHGIAQVSPATCLRTLVDLAGRRSSSTEILPTETQAGHGATGDGDGGRPRGVDRERHFQEHAKVPPASQWGHGHRCRKRRHRARPPLGLSVFPGPVAGAADLLCGLWALGRRCSCRELLEAAHFAVEHADAADDLDIWALASLHRPGAHHGAGVETAPGTCRK